MRAYPLHLLISLALLLPLSACSDDEGNGPKPALPALGQSMDGQVFVLAHSYPSQDPLQNLDKGAKKTLIYFENTSAGLRYVKVAMDLASLSYAAYVGKVSFEEASQVTFEDTHLCAGGSGISEQLKGETLEVMINNVSGCATPAAGPQTYNLKSETARGTLYLYDAAGSISMVRLHRSLPAGVASEVRPLLGVYSLMSPGSCWEHTPKTTLLIYALADSTLRYTWLQELSAGGSFSGYSVEEGTVTRAGSTLTFSPDFAGGCPSKIYAYVDEAPTYPPAVLVTGTHCTKGQVSPSSAYSYTYGKSGCASNNYDQLLLTSPAGSNSYMKTGLTVTGFPATSGTGAHYIWSVIPKS